MKAIDTIKDLVTSKAGIQLLKAQKHAPVALFAVGVVGVVGTVVVACRATLKMDAILSEAEEALAKGQRLHEKSPALYTEEIAQRDKVKIYTQTGVKIIKAYAPALGLFVVSIASLTGSHVVLTKRNVALGAAFATMSKAFEGYRERVIETYGNDKDVEFLYGTEDIEITEKDKNGEEKTRKAKQIGSRVTSPYAVLFDDVNSTEWSKDPWHNQMFIQVQQEYANNRLRSRGYVFLSDVLESLGIEPTKASRVVGWVAGKGDDYVDFGIFKGNIETKTRFVNGDERSIWLDFNVDGNILESFGGK